MNKYTKKIVHFIDCNSDLFKKYAYQEHAYIGEIDKIVQANIKKSHDYKMTETIIPKLHSISSPPVVYVRNKHLGISLEEFSELHRKKSSKIKHDVSVRDKSRSVLNDILYDNDFVSLDVQQHAETQDLIKYVIHGSITIYTPTRLAKNIVSDIINRVSVLSDIFKKTYKPKLKIFYGDQKKEFPKTRGAVLCPDNVNSGCSLTGSYIMIWRREEFNKVLVHELIHYFGFDNTLGMKVNSGIRDKYVIGHDSPKEALVEFFAIVINAVIVIVQKNYKVNDIINYEFNHTLFQICKILRHFNITDIIEPNGKIHTNTSTFSYFIVKGAFLYYKNFNTALDFVKSPHKDYGEFINDCMTREYLGEINRLLGVFDGLDISSNFIKNNLRMSVFS